MNNQYIQYPLKWSVKPPKSISAFRALVGSTKRVLQCFDFPQIVQTLCDSRAQFFKNYIPGSQKFLSLIHQNFHFLCCKTRFVLSTKARNAEVLSGGFTDHFSGYLNVLIIHEFLTAGYLGFWRTMPVSRGSYSMPKPREFVHNKSETLFRIASHF